MEEQVKVIVVRPEDYPDVRKLESISELQEEKCVRIQAYTGETVILAKPQVEGMKLNRAVYEDDGRQIRQVIAGDFVVCGLNPDRTLRGLTREEVSLYLERFRQMEKFISAGSVLFAVPTHRIYV